MSSSPFVVEWVARLAGGDAGSRRALDVASGAGRHAAVLARAGFRTFGVDVDLEALRAVAAAARDNPASERGTILLWCADLTRHPLPASWFDLIVVTRYLQRDLFPSLRASVKPGGAIVYETFTTRQRELGRRPTSPDHLLEPGELRRYFERGNGFELLADEEIVDQDAVARVVARRRSAS